MPEPHPARTPPPAPAARSNPAPAATCETDPSAPPPQQARTNRRTARVPMLTDQDRMAKSHERTARRHVRARPMAPPLPAPSEPALLPIDLRCRNDASDSCRGTSEPGDGPSPHPPGGTNEPTPALASRPLRRNRTNELRRGTNEAGPRPEPAPLPMPGPITAQIARSISPAARTNPAPPEAGRCRRDRPPVLARRRPLPPAQPRAGPAVTVEAGGARAVRVASASSCLSSRSP